MKSIRNLASVSLSVLLAGCLPTLDMRDPVPEPLVERASVADFGTIRYYSDDADSLERLALARIQHLKHKFANQNVRGKRFDINFLSLSGGGSDGAFGAGFLVGWSERGTRPQFDAVSGISTGAMIAPLAFLGPKYDQQLREAYTTISTDDVAQRQVLSAILGQSAGLVSTEPLQRLIAKYMTQEMLEEIAVAHRNGRMLLIGTTNLDAQKSVIWDIGAIANSGRTDALALTRQIILASAAIPGAFPPVEVNVQADGKPFVELHVDGGVTRQVFLYPPGYSPTMIDRAIGWKPNRRAYIIRNSKVDPQFKAIEAKLLPIASRSIDTLIKTQGVGDLYKIYMIAKRDGVDYNLTYIPPDFNVQSSSAFDKVYMNALFQKGYEMARSGYQWEKAPPATAF
ncbi:patatin-like phospholipase family protein [Prosthecomicrobium sp. N25]|uniref:patatin-like phospholipase family protein n=1 Tax=Prosthecomicrobium sp. N25 TaxID=3129254 RepID=UPI00307734B4